MNDLSIQALEKTAESYQELLVPALFEKYAAKIINEIKIEPHANVLDVACGTGVVACKVAERLDYKGGCCGTGYESGYAKSGREVCS